MCKPDSPNESQGGLRNKAECSVKKKKEINLISKNRKTYLAHIHSVSSASLDKMSSLVFAGGRAYTHTVAFCDLEATVESRYKRESHLSAASSNLGHCVPLLITPGIRQLCVSCLAKAPTSSSVGEARAQFLLWKAGSLSAVLRPYLVLCSQPCIYKASCWSSCFIFF